MYAEIAALIACTGFLAWWTRKLAQESALALIQEVKNLDENLATVIERVLEGLPGGSAQAQNPLHAIIAQVFQAKMSQEGNSPDVTVIEKDALGKFTKNNP